MDDFEAFTRERIARLRAEAEALEKTLKEYMSARARMSGAARRSGGDNPRSGAFGTILDAINQAGPEGLTLDQMIEAAETEGFSVNRNTLRSQLWQAKKDDLVVPVGTGRYRAPGAETPEQSAGTSSSARPGRSAEWMLSDLQAAQIKKDIDDEIPF